MPPTITEHEFKERCLTTPQDDEKDEMDLHVYRITR